MRRIATMFLAAVAAGGTGCRTTDGDASDVLDNALVPPVFPATFTPETGLPAYAVVRMEGQSKIYTAKYALDYYQKWFKKKYTAPPEALAHFDAQRELYKYLMSEAATPAAGGQTASLAMVGDLMWIRDHWDTFVADDVRAELGKHDAVVGNLETPVDRDRSVPSLLADYLSYNAAPGLVRSFRRADGRNLFTVLGTANNHTFDMKDAGARATMKFLDEEKILHTGVRADAGAKNYVVFEAKGLKFGVYATTWGFNDQSAAAASVLKANRLAGSVPEAMNQTELDVDLSDLEAALAAMSAEGVDVRIVNAHWGHEFEYYPTPATMRLARRIVEAGADVIIGAHPHVQQPNEVCFVNGYEAPAGLDEAAAGCRLTSSDGRARKAFIAYSLGNFATNMWSFLCEVGTIASLEFFRTGAGAVDWRAPRHVFVHNQRRVPGGGRRLALLSGYVGGGCGGGTCTDDERAFASFVERHMTSSHIDQEEIDRLTVAGKREAKVFLGELAQVIGDLPSAVPSSVPVTPAVLAPLFD